ncbi:MAG: putative selenium-dependent hydroxylase accessory protein YqeC [Deinococcus sp.]|nr:putative selenium-dependent hydroxylase accessory protein YqeC [Deinococcus sp.]
MELSQALDVRPKEVVAFIGAGGKTTALRRLGSELAARGRRVLLTSTTKIEPQAGEVDTECITSLEQARQVITSRPDWSRPLLLVTERLPTRLRGMPPEWVDALTNTVDYLLVQADGSARRPFKAPAAHEPVLPRSATLVVAVLGLEAIGSPIDDEHVHRPELVAEFSGLPLGAALTIQGAAQVLLHPRGGFRNVPAGARRMVLMNKVDDAERLATAQALTQLLMQAGIPRVLLASLRTTPPVRQLWLPGQVVEN